MTARDVQYIGAVSLLGRIAGRELTAEDRALIKRAMDDCAAAFPGRFEVVRASGLVGWALEPVVT